MLGNQISAGYDFNHTAQNGPRLQLNAVNQRPSPHDLSVRPQGNADVILRWNRCVRLLHGLSRTEQEKEAVGLCVADGAPVA